MSSKSGPHAPAHGGGRQREDRCMEACRSLVDVEVPPDE